MAEPAEKRNRLASWKEIAGYLKVSERTAQNYEKQRRLPVRRTAGARSQVYAIPSELDRWAESDATEHASEDTIERKSPSGRWRYIAAVATAGFVIIVGCAYYVFASGSRAPHWYHITGGLLGITDDHGQELWTARFEEPLSTEQYRQSEQESRRRIWIGDLDNDGRQEVLFAKMPFGFGQHSYLVCFSDRGVENWRFKPGKKVTSGKPETFSDLYAVEDFIVAPFGEGGAFQIVVSSNHVPDWPNQVALLSAQGNVVGEYWHSGYLERLTYSGRDIYLTGMANGYVGATLVVLDAGQIEGASREDNPSFQLQGFSPAREKARLMFPRTCIGRRLEEGDIPTTLRVDGKSIVVAMTARRPPTFASVWYVLTTELKLTRFELSNEYRSHHAQLRTMGLLDHDLMSEEEAVPGPFRFVGGTDFGRLGGNE